MVGRSHVTSMDSMFSGAWAFDQDLGWCVDYDVTWTRSTAPSVSRRRAASDRAPARRRPRQLRGSDSDTCTHSYLIATDGWGDDGIRTAVDCGAR